MASLQHIVKSNEGIKCLINSLEKELSELRKKAVRQKKLELLAQNEVFKRKVEDTTHQLISLMLRNGKSVIPVPGSRTLFTTASESCIPRKMDNLQMEGALSKKIPPLSIDKKPKIKKAPSLIKPAGEQPVDVSRLDLRVGKILEVSRHPDADSLYVEKIDCGEEQPRTVVSGLVKYVPIEEMQGRLVIVLCNLKPVKMRGITSEAMVMCATFPDKVEILNPPKDAVPGDPVFCEAYNRQPDVQLNPKKKIFEAIAPDLRTNDAMVATYKGKAMFVPGKDVIRAPSLCNAHVK